MKKLVLFSTIAASLIGMSSFGQGYLQLQSGNKTIWENGTYKTGSGGLVTTNSYALVWGSTTLTPLVDAIQASVATNALPGVAAAGTVNGNYSVAAAWTAILTDPNFTLATDLAGPNLATGIALQNGSLSYNGGGSFAVSGAGAGVWSLFYIAWNDAGGVYLTPSAAQAAGELVGWSTVFNMTLTGTVSDPLIQQTSGLVPFGVAGGAVPEPTTIAFGALGGLSLLLMRRKKA